MNAPEQTDRRQQDTLEQEWFDQMMDDEHVLQRVKRGETTECDYTYLAARLNYRGK